VGLAVKHRQLARQVGVVIDDTQENSMATFNFTSAMLDAGITFIFGLWFCVADDTGSFRRRLVDNMKPKAPAATPQHDLDEFIDNLSKMLLPDLAREIKEQSVFDVTSTRTAPGLLRSDLIWSQDLRTRFRSGYATRPLFTRRPWDLKTSPHWRKTWITYYNSEEEKPPRVGGLPSSTTSQILMMTLRPY
jgi:hypothetical protein